MKLLPMNAYEGSTDILTDSKYIFEPKLDGYRALCLVEKDSLTFISRNGNNITSDYPEFKFRKQINAKSCILDGEIVVFDKHGNPNFELLQQGFKEATYVVFDILKKDGELLTAYPLNERKVILESTVDDGHRINKITYTEHGKKLYALMGKKHLEGVMAKQIDSRYYPNKRTRVWLKVKFKHTVDAVVIGFTQSKRQVSSLALGLYDTHGKLYYIGKVGTGFSQEDIAHFAKKFKDLKRDAIKLANPDAPVRGIKWLKPHLVAEIDYVQVTKAKILRSPSFIRLRTDKKFKQCTLDQLHIVK